MTPNRKRVIQLLMQGATIANCGSSGIRVRDSKGNPVMKISKSTYRRCQYELMRKCRKTGLFVVDKRKVRSMHGNCLAKKIYKNAVDNF